MSAELFFSLRNEEDLREARRILPLFRGVPLGNWDDVQPLSLEPFEGYDVWRPLLQAPIPPPVSPKTPDPIYESNDFPQNVPFSRSFDIEQEFFPPSSEIFSSSSSAPPEEQPVAADTDPEPEIEASEPIDDLELIARLKDFLKGELCPSPP